MRVRAGMAPSGAATYDVFVTFTAKSNNASNAKYNVNGTFVSVNQRVSPSGGWYKLGTFLADASGKITIVLSDNANGNVVADAAEVVINAPAAASASAAAAVAQRSDNTALMSATDFWMSDLGNQPAKRKQLSETSLDLLSAEFDPLV